MIFFTSECLYVWISSMRYQLMLPKKAAKFEQNPPYFFNACTTTTNDFKKTWEFFFRTLRPFQKTTHTYLNLLYVVWIFVCLDFTYVRIPYLYISQNLPFFSTFFLLYIKFAEAFVFREFGIGDQIPWTSHTKWIKVPVHIVII